MERVGVSKVYPGLAKFFIVFGLILFLFGIAMLIKSLINGFNIHFPAGDWNSVTYTIQGILFILLGYFNLKKRKYFIEWDDSEFRYLLPDTKKIETINFEQIESVTIGLFEIDLKLKTGIRTLTLDNLRFEDLRRIKEKFENTRLIGK
jgi:hypothetical protein